MSDPTLRVVFMGTPAFAVPSLDALLRHGHDVVGVFTSPTGALAGVEGSGPLRLRSPPSSKTCRSSSQRRSGTTRKAATRSLSWNRTSS